MTVDTLALLDATLGTTDFYEELRISLSVSDSLHVFPNIVREEP